jgi:plasmid maintenance system antidote protein VapI
MNYSRGEAHYASKITNDAAILIRSQYATGQFTYQQLADMFGTTLSTVTHLIQGRTRVDLISDASPANGAKPNYYACGERCHMAKLTEDDVRHIRADYVPYQLPLQTLAAKYGITFATVHKIVTGRTWKHVR